MTFDLYVFLRSHHRVLSCSQILTSNPKIQTANNSQSLCFSLSIYHYRSRIADEENFV